MAEEIKGLEYLKKNQIKNKICKMDKPFAFISYSHNERDSQIVMNVFKKLFERNVNLWIDVANIPNNENAWDYEAIKALKNYNCKFAFFFRSEESLQSENILDEIEYIKKIKHIGDIVTIDIWRDEDNNADKYLYYILNNAEVNEIKIIKSFYKYVRKDCSAIRLSNDLDNDADQLANDMFEKAEYYGIINENNSSKKEINDIKEIEKVKAETGISHPKPEPNITITNNNTTTSITETTTLAEFEKLCESVDFCQKLRTARKQKHGAGQIFDFLVASLLGGCDKKIPDDKNTSVHKGAFNYCVYAISEVVDLENVKLGASQYTWMSNARKAMRKEDMPDNFFNDKGKVKSGTLGEYSTIFEQLSSDMTIGEVLDKYKAKERGFHTKNNEGIFEAWELIKNIDVKEGKKGLEELM